MSSAVRVGAHVKVGAKKGVVRFIGATSFAAGEWYGVELALPKGKNDGTVNGETYFRCAPDHGLFCKKAQVRKDRSYRPSPAEEEEEEEEEEGADAASSASSASSGDPEAAEAPAESSKPLAAAAGGGAAAAYAPRVGDRARFKEQEGRVSFVGETQFSSGTWCGLVLDTPGGKNDGTVQGVRYFECAKKHGLFVRPVHLARVASAVLAEPVAKELAAEAAEAAATPPPPQLKTKEATPPPSAVSTPSATSTPMTPVRSAGASPGRAQTQSRLLREQRKALKAHEKTISELREEVQQKDAEITRLLSSSTSSPSSEIQPEAADDRMRSLESKHSAAVAALRADVAAAEERAGAAESKCNALQARLSRLESQQDKTQESARKKAAATSKAERRCKELEEEVADLNEMVENLTLEKEEFQLEKELAEEKAVDLQLELEQKSAALDDAQAASVATSSSSTSSGGSTKTDSGGAQNNHDELVSQNNKLREALLRLRDSSAHERADSERRILALEKDAWVSREASEKVRTLEAENARLEEAVEHLKDQVDDANGFETLVEDLTERNIELTDEAAELSASVAELEELRDLSEEVEAQHVEFTQQLHEEVREKEAALAVLAMRLREADERDSMQQRDIDRFRDLSHAQVAELEENRRKVSWVVCCFWRHRRY
jgi:dynactin 1